MKRLIAMSLSSSLILLVSLAWAYDSTTRKTTLPNEQMMRDCLAKQKEDKSTTKTNDQMMKTCQEQVKAGKRSKPKDEKAASEPTPN
jgi:hypothetical protein